MLTVIPHPYVILSAAPVLSSESTGAKSKDLAIVLNQSHICHSALDAESIFEPLDFGN
jgi:hypothetical protein